MITSLVLDGKGILFQCSLGIRLYTLAVKRIVVVRATI
jgi:hypothetical protein